MILSTPPFGYISLSKLSVGIPSNISQYDTGTIMAKRIAPNKAARSLLTRL